jgi:REP element-mobilizing transposase RayT
MSNNNDSHRRRSLRLQNFNYAAAGAYFVTICTHQRAEVFGHIEANTVTLSSAGKVIESVWEEIPAHHASVAPDEFVVMPNHIHGILVIHESPAGARVIESDSTSASVEAQFIAPKSASERVEQNHTAMVGAIVRAFKARCTHAIHQAQSAETTIWQRNYYEHIIRNEKELMSIREYISNNPMQWDLDANNPHAKNLGVTNVWES